VASSKTMLAVGLAAATLVVFVVVIAMGGALRAGLAPWPGIAVAVLATAAFAVARSADPSWWRDCLPPAASSASCMACYERTS
jgi:hypothetical protein